VNITLSTVAASDTVTMTATTGSIMDANGINDNVLATNLVMSAVTGIGTAADPIETTVTNITATNTGAGDVVITELDGANLLNVTTLNGNVTVTSITGNLNVTTVVASNTATLVATAGAITDANDANINVTATNLVARAETGINLDTNVNDITAFTSGMGNITIDEASGVNLTNVTTTNGFIFITAGGTMTGENVVAGGVNDQADVALITTSGNIAVNKVTAVDTVRLDAAGAIDDGDADIDIGAANAILIARSGIGAAGDPLETAFVQLEASGGTGGVFINNTGNLRIGNISALNGISASGGDVSLETNGTLTILEPVSNSGGGNVTVSASGDVTQFVNITATGAGVVTVTSRNGSITMANGATTSSVTGDINYNAGGSIAVSVMTTDGNVNLTAMAGSISDSNGAATNVTAVNLTATAATGIDLDTKVTNITATNTGAGNVTIDELDGANVLNVTDANGNVTITSATGNLNVTTIAANTAGNTVTLTATAGQITDANGAANNITATNLAMTAASGIGTAADPMETTVSNLAASGGTGGVFITNTGALTITTVSGVVGVTATGSHIVVTAISPITVNEAVTNSGGGNISLTAVGSGAADDITINAPITASGGSGDITLTAADNVIQNANVSAASSGTVNVTATAGSITMANGTSTTSGSGNITYSAGGSAAISVLNTTGDVNVTATAGNISDSNGAATNVTGEDLTATSATGIDLDTNVTTITGNVTGTGAVNINELNAVTLTSVTTNDGAITVTAGGTMRAINVVAGGTGRDISLTTTAGGNIIVDFVSALGDRVTLNSAGNVDENPDPQVDIEARILEVNAVTGIGVTDTIEICVDILIAMTNSGGIDLNECNAITLRDVLANSGNVVITNNAGSMTVDRVRALEGGVLLDSARSIFDGNGDDLNVWASSDSALIARGGVIGGNGGAREPKDDPFDVEIIGGRLGVVATEEETFISVNIRGMVDPSNFLDIFNVPPGLVLFNNRIIGGDRVEQEFRATSELNSDVVFGPGYLGNLIGYALGQKFFSLAPYYYEVDEELLRRRR
jgi:hypothetical protein